MISIHSSFELGFVSGKNDHVISSASIRFLRVGVVLVILRMVCKVVFTLSHLAKHRQLARRC